MNNNNNNNNVYVLLNLAFSLVTLININLLNETNRRLYNFVRLHNFFINDHNYRQLVSAFITNKQTLLDHFYTNLAESEANIGKISLKAL
jgi:hypothetical protein